MAVNPTNRLRWTTEEWESEIGRQVRRARLAVDWSQATLAEQANISLSAVKGLEAGQGSSLRTLIRAVRALGLDDWLLALSPDPGVDPIALADAMRKSAPRKRASRQGDADV